MAKTTKTEKQSLMEEVVGYLIIDINDIQSEIVKHSANYAYLAQRFAQAKGRAADLKVDLDYRKGLALIESKGMTFTDGNGKESGVTDTLAKSYVDVDYTVVDIKRRLARAEEELAFWQSIIDAMYQRSYMLTKLADMQVHELMLAGSEYNEGIRQDVRRQVFSGDEYERMTSEAKLNKQRSQLQSLREARQLEREAHQRDMIGTDAH